MIKDLKILEAILFASTEPILEIDLKNIIPIKLKYIPIRLIPDLHDVFNKFSSVCLKMMKAVGQQEIIWSLEGFTTKRY